MSEEPRPHKARRVFIESVLGVVNVERTPQMEKACDLMLMRMVEQGVVVMAMSEETAQMLAVKPDPDIPSSDTTSAVEATDGTADVQGSPIT